MAGAGRSKATIFSRVSEFDKEGMYVFDQKSKIMMCSNCNVRVAWERKSVIDNHCASASHKNNKANRQQQSDRKRQASVGDTLDHAKKIKDDKEEFVKSTGQAFMAANIPLSKLDDKNIRNWMDKYIKGGGDMAHERWAREKYVPLVKADYEESVKKAVKDKKIIIHCDETTDRRGQAVFIIIFKILPHVDTAEVMLLVAAVTVLESCTGELCSKAILQAVNKFEVKFSNAVAILSDAAPYMILCVRLLQELMNPQLIHLQCWGHKLDKVSKVFSEKLPRLNECVKRTKKFFKNARKRKNGYMKFLKDKYASNKKKEAKLFPQPIMIRFGSWTRSAVYLCEYLDDVVEYAKSLPTQEQNVKAVKYFDSLNKEDIAIIKAEATFVKEYNEPICNLLALVEGTRYPMAHKLYPKLKELLAEMSVLYQAEKVSDVLKSATKKSLSAVEKLSSSKAKNVKERMQKTAKECHSTLNRLISKDSGNECFNAAETLFHPPKMLSHDLTNPESILKAKRAIAILSAVPDAEFLVLYDLLRDEVRCSLTKSKPNSKTDLVELVLIGFRATNLGFAVSCLQVLHLSVGNIDSERGFSAYGDIVSAKRCRLLPENAETMLSLYFSDDFGDEVCTE